MSEAHGRLDASANCLTLHQAGVVLFIPRQPVIDYLVTLGYLTRLDAGAQDHLLCTQAGSASGWVRQGCPEEIQAVSSDQPLVTPAGIEGLAEHFRRGVRATIRPVIPPIQKQPLSTARKWSRSAPIASSQR